jgi:hypothetical protein
MHIIDAIFVGSSSSSTSQFVAEAVNAADTARRGNMRPFCETQHLDIAGSKWNIPADEERVECKQGCIAMTESPDVVFVCSGVCAHCEESTHKGHGMISIFRLANV